MKFKIVKGNPLYDSFMELKKRTMEVNKAANDFAKKVGGKASCRSQNVAYGGISAIEFDAKPEGWRMVGDKYRHLFFPKATNKELLKEIAALPKIQYDEINNIVGFDAPQTVTSNQGILWVNCVGISYGKDYILLNVTSGAKYNPPKHVIEILESEYEKLNKKSK